MRVSTSSPARRVATFVGLAVSAFSLAFASAAFACSPRCCFATIYDTSGAPESKVTVKGAQFGDAIAQIRWNAVDGPLLATATGSDWTQTITVPKVAPDFYVIVVFGIDPTTNEMSPPEAKTFQVTGSSPTVVAGQVPAPAPTPAMQASTEQSTTPVVPSAPSPAPPSPAPATPVAVATPVARAIDGPVATPVTPVTQTMSVPAAPQSSSSPGTIAAGSRARLASPTMAPVVTPAGPVAVADQSAVAAPAREPAGVAASPLPRPWSIARKQSTGLLEGASKRQAPLGWGLGALGVGLVVLLAAATVAAVRQASVRSGQTR